jgi:hypothetical protein
MTVCTRQATDARRFRSVVTKLSPRMALPASSCRSVAAAPVFFSLLTDGRRGRPSDHHATNVRSHANLCERRYLAIMSPRGQSKPINAMMVLELADDAEAVRVARDLAATLQRTVILKDQEGTVLATVSQTATVRARVEASIKNE